MYVSTCLCDSVHVRMCMCVYLLPIPIILTRKNRGGQRSLHFWKAWLGIVLYPNIKYGSIAFLCTNAYQFLVSS